MVQQVVSSADTLPPVQQVVPELDTDGNPVVFAFRWEWGETGKCSAERATLLQQTAGNLGRSIQIYPIAPAAPAPLLRDERTQLVARTLVLESELQEAKAAGAAQYTRAQDLALQLNTSIVQARELKAQVQDRDAQLVDAAATVDRLQADNGALLVELERLRQLETLFNEQTEPEPAGGETTVVDG